MCLIDDRNPHLSVLKIHYFTSIFKRNKLIRELNISGLNHYPNKYAMFFTRNLSYILMIMTHDFTKFSEGVL